MSKNDILRRVLKKREIIKKILFTLYSSRYKSNQYLSVKGLVSLTGIPESTIKGDLKNLLNKGWIEKRSYHSSPNELYITRTNYLTDVRITNKGKIREFWVPQKIADEFEKKLLELKRSKTRIENDVERTLKITIITYKDEFDALDPRVKSRVLKEHSLTFHGKTRLVNSLLEKWYAKKLISFYKILVFPYRIDDRVGGRTNLGTKEMLLSRWTDIPKKDEEFWSEAAEELEQKKKKMIKYFLKLK